MNPVGVTSANNEKRRKRPAKLRGVSRKGTRQKLAFVRVDLWETQSGSEATTRFLRFLLCRDDAQEEASRSDG